MQDSLVGPLFLLLHSMTRRYLIAALLVLAGCKKHDLTEKEDPKNYPELAACADGCVKESGSVTFLFDPAKGKSILRVEIYPRISFVCSSEIAPTPEEERVLLPMETCRAEVKADPLSMPGLPGRRSLEWKKPQSQDVYPETPCPDTCGGGTPDMPPGGNSHQTHLPTKAEIDKATKALKKLEDRLDREEDIRFTSPKKEHSWE